MEGERRFGRLVSSMRGNTASRRRSAISAEEACNVASELPVSEEVSEKSYL